LSREASPPPLRAAGEVRWVDFTGRLDAEARAKGHTRVLGIAADLTARHAAAAPAHYQ
jgi:hypothetical protein